MTKGVVPSNERLRETDRQTETERGNTQINRDLVNWILTSSQPHRVTSGRERETERDRQTDRQRQRDAERQRTLRYNKTHVYNTLFATPDNGELMTEPLPRAVGP